MNLAPASGIPLDRTLVLALRDALQVGSAEPVQLEETHISWILLAGSLAYKLKKPIRLPFVDFETLAARRRFCEEEVRLNRRLAPSLYLGVVPVGGSAQAPVIDASGDAIDYLVAMRRFPAGALLSERLAAGSLLPMQLERLGRRLAAFHEEAPRAPSTSACGVPQQVLPPVRKLLAQIAAAYGDAAVKPLKRWLAAQAWALRRSWRERRRLGAVRECHGDLHLANLLIDGEEPTAFDCIEFDPALRWIDVMSDVAFLTMDLKAHGRSDLAFQFLDAYLQGTGDYAGVEVLRFHEVCRALVRATVQILRPDTGGGADYLACAQLWIRNDGGEARLLVTHGLSGSGKSTIASRLVGPVGAIRLRSDVERKRLFGLAPLQRSDALPESIYTPEATRRTMERLREGARMALRAGYPVIVDAAFLQRAERESFRMLAAELGRPFTILHCRTGDLELLRRLRARTEAGEDASEADAAVLERQRVFEQPLEDDELAFVIDVATDGAVDEAALAARWRAMRPLPA